MSGQIHADFLWLLWVLPYKQMRSYYESLGKEDKIGTEAFRWARAKVFNCNKTSVGRVIAFGCAASGKTQVVNQHTLQSDAVHSHYVPINFEHVTAVRNRRKNDENTNKAGCRDLKRRKLMSEGHM